MKGSNGVLSKGQAQTYLGKMTAYRKASDTLLRGAKVTTQNNPRTAAQTYQRLKMYSSVPLYKVLSEAIALGWENVPARRSLYNCYTGAAMRSTPFGISKEMYEKGGGICWPAMITKGSLPVVIMHDNESNIMLDNLNSITTATTVAQLSKAIVDANPGVFEYDDEIAFVEVRQTVDAQGTPKLSCTRSAVVLDANDNETLASLPSMKGFGVSNGYLALSGDPAVGGYAYIHSRIKGGKMYVSTQELICNNDAIMDAYSAPAKLRLAAVSIGADLTSDKFLKPTTALDRKVQAAFGLNFSRIKGMMGGTVDGIMAVEHNGGVYFPGDEAFTLTGSAQMKITVTDGSKLASAVSVKVNGQSVSSPTKDGNVIAVTIPSALDGTKIDSIQLSDGSRSWKLEF